jgi:hypothetical protein
MSDHSCQDRDNVQSKSVKSESKRLSDHTCIHKNEGQRHPPPEGGDAGCNYNNKGRDTHSLEVGKGGSVLDRGCGYQTRTKTGGATLAVTTT